MEPTITAVLLRFMACTAAGSTTYSRKMPKNDSGSIAFSGIAWLVV
jgi:hypothetical protein